MIAGMLLVWTVVSAVAASLGAWRAGLHTVPRGSWVLFAVCGLAGLGIAAALQARRSPMNALVGAVSAGLLTTIAAVIWFQ